MAKPNTLDKDGAACLLVVKTGNATGTTFGRANGVYSFVREYFSNGTHWTSKEWAILPYSQKDGAFSAVGDSGAVVADGHGRIGGMLTGGAGKTAEDLDISYATPFWWLLPRIIKANGFPDAHLNPVMASTEL